MIIVSNTSPLTNLAAIGQFDLLHKLFGQLQIAEAVVDELNVFGRKWPGSDEVANASWITKHTVENQLLIRSFRRDIDRGEAETIALAIEHNADLVLLDERAGRQLARTFDLNVTGVLGVLLQAKSAGHILKVRPLVDALRYEAGFYLSDLLYQRILHLARE